MKMIINGEQVKSCSDQVIEVLNPATNQLIDTVPKANEKDVYRAIEAAKVGQKKWEKLSMYQRGETLKSL